MLTLMENIHGRIKTSEMQENMHGKAAEHLKNGKGQME
jgi:hypothetical protein